MTALALKLLDGFDKHISSEILLSRRGHYVDRRLYWGYHMRFIGLHNVAYFGIVETAAAVLQMKKWDPDATEVAGNIPTL